MTLRKFIGAVILDDASVITGELAKEQETEEYFAPALGRQVYRGDTALHLAAAGHCAGMVRKLIEAGADVGARNRRGATPLHSAAGGDPNSVEWNPARQVSTIAALINAGADVNAVDKNGAMPLHKAIRSRCAAAVEVLLSCGADASKAMHLAVYNTGRGGSGSAAMKAQQAEIKRLLSR